MRFSRFLFPIEGVAPVGKLKEADSFPSADAAAASSSSSSSSRGQGYGPICICLAPTRDLVNQTFNCYRQFGAPLLLLSLLLLLLLLLLLPLLFLDLFFACICSSRGAFCMSATQDALNDG